MRVIGYLRQSDEEGHKREMSIPLQDAAFRAFLDGLRASGAIVEWEIYKDEGRSGGDWSRPGFQAMLERLDWAGVVWAYDLERLVRHEDHNDLTRELRRRSIHLYTHEGEVDIHSPTGQLTTSIRLQMGAYFRQMVAERTRQNRDLRLRGGYWSGPPPIGYQYTDEAGPGSKRILVPGADAPKIQALFALIASGVSQKAACREVGLNYLSVQYHRSNPLYIGLVYKHRRTRLDAVPDMSYASLWALADSPDVDWILPGRHEPLVDAATWDRVQRRYPPHKARRRSERHALSGMVRCALCGRKMTMNHPPGKRNASLRCMPCGWQKSTQIMEATLLAAILILTEATDLEAEIARALETEQEPDARLRLEDLRRERTKQQARLDRALDALLDLPEVSDGLRTRIVTLQEKINGIDEHLAALTASEATRPANIGAWQEFMRELVDADIREDWWQATGTEKRGLLQDIFREIHADREGLTIACDGLPAALTVPYVGRHMVAGPGHLASAYTWRA